MDRSNYRTRLLTQREDDDDDEYIAALSPGERVAMVWELTLQAYEFMQGGQVEPRLRRDVARVERREG